MRERRLRRRAARHDRRDADDAGGVQRCASLANDAARSCYAEELEAVVDEAADPAAALEEIAVAAYTSGDGFLPAPATAKQ